MEEMLMKRLLLISCSALMIGIIAQGCASIATGTSQSVSITSNVNDAKLFLDGSEIGTTPFNGIIPKNKKEIKIVKEGYQTETIVLSKTLEGIFWGNIILGGTVGSITDFASGAAYTYAPATYQIDLKANDQTSSDFERQYMIRKFSMIYIDEISRNVATGGGEYTSALIDMLRDGTDHAIDLEDIRAALESSYGDQTLFGKAIVDLI